MHTFKDKNGTEWHIEINVPQIKKIKGRLSINGDGFDLLGGKGTFMEAMRQLSEDPILLVDTLYLLCEDEANERGISDVQFGQALVGDAIEDATDALLAEYVDFFPARQQTMYRNLLTKGEQALDRLMTEQEKQINEITEEKIYEIIQADLSYGKKSTNSQGKQK